MAAAAAESEGREREREVVVAGWEREDAGEGIDGQTGCSTLARHYAGTVDFCTGPRWAA
jgi:hypothetical protein